MMDSFHLIEKGFRQKSNLCSMRAKVLKQHREYILDKFLDLYTSIFKKL